MEPMDPPHNLLENSYSGKNSHKKAIVGRIKKNKKIDIQTKLQLKKENLKEN